MRFIKINIFSFLLVAVFGVSSCTKFDTTSIGSSLLPTVDNINTFADSLSITTSQGFFKPDSTIISRTDNHVLGYLNDPLFGTTKANVFAEIKPQFFPFYFGNANDTINNSLVPGTGFDSVVLCLSYKGVYGDSTLPLQLTVKEILPSTHGQWDSANNVRNLTYTPLTGATLGTATVDVRRLKDTIQYAKTGLYSVNTIRIKLASSFANSLFTRDSSYGGSNNAFRSDSNYMRFQKGFAIYGGTSGNSLAYINLNDTATKLEVHYRKRNGGAIDTGYTSFRVASASSGNTFQVSATSNNIIRNWSGSVLSPGTNDIYLQSTPGTFANLQIPALTGYGNKIVHRAEIIVQQIPTNLITDSILNAPAYLYVDLKDTTITPAWKPIYFDLNPSVAYYPDLASSYMPSIDYSYFGGARQIKKDGYGNSIKYYSINVTRYVQQIATKGTTNYGMRLYAPYELSYPQYSQAQNPYNNNLAYGRVRVGSGTNANYKMFMRVLYSKVP